MKKRRIRIEWMKAGIAFIVFITGVVLADSEFYITPMTLAVLALVYLRILAIRLQKRGAY